MNAVLQLLIWSPVESRRKDFEEHIKRRKTWVQYVPLAAFAFVPPFSANILEAYYSPFGFDLVRFTALLFGFILSIWITSRWISIPLFSRFVKTEGDEGVTKMDFLLFYWLFFPVPVLHLVFVILKIFASNLTGDVPLDLQPELEVSVMENSLLLVRYNLMPILVNIADPAFALIATIASVQFFRSRHHSSWFVSIGFSLLSFAPTLFLYQIVVMPFVP